jgi:hypothetical protein
MGFEIVIWWWHGENWNGMMVIGFGDNFEVHLRDIFNLFSKAEKILIFFYIMKKW